MPIPNIFPALFNGTSDGGNGGYEIPSLPHINRATFAGIVVAISGNVVISLALNCQKLAHKRLEAQRAAEGDELQSQSTSGKSSDLHYFSVILYCRARKRHMFLRRGDWPQVIFALARATRIHGQPRLADSSSC